MILLDTIGELPATYALAQIVFVGGSIVDKGGHNVLEPAAAGATVVTGAHTHNFHAIVELMNEAGALVQLPPLEDAAASDEIAYVFEKLLANPEEREELGRRAKQLITANQGAADRTMQLIAPPHRAARLCSHLMKSIVLPPLSLLYGAVTRTRLSLYRRGTFHTTKLDRPVISIGNITTGGTGKTPLVEYVARTIASQGKKVCILTRGYGRKDPHLQVIVSDGYGVLASPS